MDKKINNWRNYIKLEFASLPENVGLARVAVASFASQVDLTLNDLEEIKVATSEAVSNAIIHGYENSPEGIVVIEAFRDETKLILTVEDRGKGIADVEQAMQPAYTTDPERMGLGFVFMKSFMDHLEVTSRLGEGTKVIMTKNLNPVDAVN
ncbi:anti-sigma F factor [Zhaonella formicivorans]|jgi:stage II sporulation protein AB (anti-sigma F factor)|uniref:anti-sigma F factor n=1 Tax=Zhaonella formicivorans TaxID=2528593 RepID=UPI0010D963F2|nr:anti-sigma F factor [Zhaonella formicivorans]